MISKLVMQKLTIAGKEYEYPDTTALVGKINELVDAVNVLQDRVEKLEKEHIDDVSKKMPKAELIEDYGYDLAEAVEDCGDLFKKGPIEPVTITDVFNEMGRLYADLWNKMEDIHRDLKNKGGNNE